MRVWAPLGLVTLVLIIKISSPEELVLIVFSGVGSSCSWRLAVLLECTDCAQFWTRVTSPKGARTRIAATFSIFFHIFGPRGAKYREKGLAASKIGEG